MKATSLTQKYRPLLLASLALVVLPLVLPLLGLSLNTGTMVVILAIATMGLNLCVGYTGLVSFGHGTWPMPPDSCSCTGSTATSGYRWRCR